MMVVLSVAVTALRGGVICYRPDYMVKNRTFPAELNAPLIFPGHLLATLT